MNYTLKLTFLTTILFASIAIVAQDTKKQTTPGTTVPAKQNEKQAPKASPANTNGKAEKKAAAPAPGSTPAPARQKMAINEQGVQTKHTAVKPRPASVVADSVKK